MSNDTQVKQDTNALMPDRMWIGARVGKHVLALLYSASDNETDDCDVEYVRADLLATVRKEEREAVFKAMIGAIAVLPSQGTMNYRRGYEEGVRDALRTLEASATGKGDMNG